MNTRLVLLGLLVAFFACNRPVIDSDIKISSAVLTGNWYTDLQDGEGIYWEDSLTSYCEIYLTDSLHRSFGESFGLLPPSVYHVRNDSILICYYSDYFDCKKPIGHKVLSVNKDTVWLSSNGNNKSGRIKTYLVRLPENEKGFFDYEWTKDNSDSLSEILGQDFDRRRWKFYSIRAGDMRGYDSALKAGYWHPQK